MAFWSVIGPEPKRNYRWVMRFGGSLQDISFALKKADKPKYKINSTTHKYLNHFFNYPGRLEWEDINIAFASVAQPDATLIIDTITKFAGYSVPASAPLAQSIFPLGQPELATIGKNKFAQQLGSSIDIVQVDADGLDLETWQMWNPFFVNVQYGSLSYDNEDIVEITCGIKYDWAKLLVGPAQIVSK